jgi:hypothetical protein
MDEQSDTAGLWAVVCSPGGRYLAKLSDPNSRIASETLIQSIIEEWITNQYLVLYDVLEFVVLNIPVQGPKGLNVAREVKALPLALNTEKHRVYSKVTDIWFLDHMSEQDQERYKDLVKTGIEHRMKSRMDQSKLAMPQG